MRSSMSSAYFPVIDLYVVKSLKRYIKLTKTDKLDQKIELHEQLRSMMNGFLKTDNGRYLLKKFSESYPEYHISKIKMLDLVLWQTRPN